MNEPCTVICTDCDFTFDAMTDEAVEHPTPEYNHRRFICSSCQSNNCWGYTDKELTLIGCAKVVLILVAGFIGTVMLFS